MRGENEQNAEAKLTECVSGGLVGWGLLERKRKKSGNYLCASAVKLIELARALWMSHTAYRK